MAVVAARPARRARPPRRRRYASGNSLEADLTAIARGQASRQGSAAVSDREERDDRERRQATRVGRAGPPARSPVEAEEPITDPLVDEVADGETMLAYQFLSEIVEELPEEELPETTDEFEEESEDLERLAETLGTGVFASVPKALLVRARGVVAERLTLVRDLLHQRRREERINGPEQGEGEEIAPGVYLLGDDRVVDDEGVVYVDVTADGEVGPVVEDVAGRRYSVDGAVGLVPLSAPPERDERGRFVSRDGAESTVAESADTQPEAEDVTENEPEEAR